VVGDNAGEIVFDRLLLETIGKPAVYAVRGGPAINDALREDASDVGMDRVADIVDTGAGAPGVIFARTPEAFRRRMREADLVISKGQGNFESLESLDRPVFYLLKAKCRVVAEHLGVELGGLVAKLSR
jgi:damage-control phosphatase, subfamily I